MTPSEQDAIPFRPAAAILRDQLADPDKLIVCPGVYDGFSARIALDAGFETIYMTGAGTAASVLGQPDLGLVTLPEMATNAGMIASLNRHVPVIADADTGFGGSLSVARATQQYIQSNVAALHIEDQVLTKRCGHLRNKALVSLDDYLVRIRAASAARKSSGRDIVIIARTDSLQSLGLDEAVRRLKAAYKTGADVAFLEGIQTKEQCLRACKELAPMPCLLNVVSGGVTPMLSAAEARELGFKIVLWPVLSLTHAYVGVKKAMRDLKDNGFVEPTPDGEGGIKDIFGVCGIEKAAAFDQAMGGSSLNGGFF